MTCKPAPYGKVTTARPRRILIQRKDVATQGSDGSIAPNWVTIASATTINWTTQNGSVKQMGDEPRADDAVIIRIRYRGDITFTPRTDRIVFGATPYDVTSVVDVGEQHQYLDFYARAAVP